MDVAETNFKNKRIKVIIAKSLFEKARGATIFKTKPTNYDGMILFGYNAFAKDIWMHRMNFPISIYFIDDNENIINSFTNILPCNKFLGIGCPKYKPLKKYKYVLEVWNDA